MATYLYEALHGPDPKTVFEFSHPMSQKPYITHPITGIPIKKVITAPNLSCGKSNGSHASGCGCCST